MAKPAFKTATRKAAFKKEILGVVNTTLPRKMVVTFSLVPQKDQTTRVTVDEERGQMKYYINNKESEEELEKLQAEIMEKKEMDLLGIS